MVGESRTDQVLSTHPASGECAMHKDAFLTPGESRRPPPLDLRSALFLDVDGTLLEIASRPELVHVPCELPVLIARLSGQRQGALALISGRPLAELDRLFGSWCGAGRARDPGFRRSAPARSGGGITPDQGEDGRRVPASKCQQGVGDRRLLDRAAVCWPPARLCRRRRDRRGWLCRSEQPRRLFDPCGISVRDCG